VSVDDLNALLGDVHQSAESVVVLFSSFLQGLDGRGYSYDNTFMTNSIGVVAFTTKAREATNYYGIYPESYQTSTRALPIGTLTGYNMFLESNIFEPVNNYYAGATFSHIDGVKHGSFIALGLARTPDVRVAVLGVLMFYNPKIYRSEFGSSGSTRIVVLQLGQVGGG
jgi:hypothetical protein